MKNEEWRNPKGSAKLMENGESLTSFKDLYISLVASK